MNKKFATVDEYIQSFDENSQILLQQMRHIIKTNAPHAQESISYGMPAYKLHGKPLVYFGGFEKHIGFYATPSGHEKFAAQLAGYKQGKGSVQFPNNKDLPLGLVAEIVQFRVKESSISH